MSKWECIVCGWIYDEAKADPDNGVPAGTLWEDVPEDWLCPDCGVGKEDFELIEESEVAAVPHHDQDEPDQARPPLIIIGTGLAGYGVAREFRKYDQDTPVIIITSDDGRSYSKPMLSTGFTRDVEADELAQLDAGSMGKQLKASIWTMTEVSEIDTENQLVKIGDNKTTIHYGKLVLALGSEVIRPPLQGDALDHVYAVNDLLDYVDFRQAIQRNNVRKLCIIGSGLIGTEFTNDLLNGGFEVEVVDPLGYCLPTLLPEPAGKAVQRALEDMGARFHFGPLVTEVNSREGGGVTVSLNNGETIDADLVVSAVGVRPRTSLAIASGLECGRGIKVNRRLETSAPNVYALGDCAEVEGHVLVYVAPLTAAARTLGKILADQPEDVVYPAMPVTIKTPACPVVVSPPAKDAQGAWQVKEDGNNVVAEFRGADGQLLGFALTGSEGTRERLELQKELPSILA